MQESRTTRPNLERSSPGFAEAGPVPSAEARDQRLYEAVLAFRAGKYDEAEVEASRLLEAVPGFFPVVLLLGMIAARTNRPDEGIERLREAIALDRRSAYARNELASLLRAEGRHDEAIVEAKHAVRLEPDDPGNHNNLGVCYLLAGRVPLAMTYFKKGNRPQTGNRGLSSQSWARSLTAVPRCRGDRRLSSGAQPGSDECRDSGAPWPTAVPARTAR